MSDREIFPRRGDAQADRASNGGANDAADGAPNDRSSGLAKRGDGRGPRADANGRRGALDPLFQVRTADIEPYTGLRYLSKLFRLIAIVLVLMLLAEVVTGLARQGMESVPTLVSEVSRLIVLAGLLWGVGDLAVLLVDVGHDVRAVRILLGRQTAHLVHHPEEQHVVRESAALADAPPTASGTPPNERRV